VTTAILLSTNPSEFASLSSTEVLVTALNAYINAIISYHLSKDIMKNDAPTTQGVPMGSKIEINSYMGYNATPAFLFL
jgi:hypothetical protein